MTKVRKRLSQRLVYAPLSFSNILRLNLYFSGLGWGASFGVEYLILATKTKMLGEMVFVGCTCGRFGALMGPPKVVNGRYSNPR